MIKTTTKCAWWAILFNLWSFIMCVTLMVLVIITASIIASPMTVGSEIVSTMATTTSALIIATVIIIIIASTGGIKLPMVALVLAPVIVLLPPSPELGSSIWFPTTVLTPIGSVAYIITSIILIMIVVVYLFILLFLLRGRGMWLRLLLRFGFTFSRFLSSSTSCTFEWFRYIC